MNSKQKFVESVVHADLEPVHYRQGKTQEQSIYLCIVEQLSPDWLI